MRNGRAKRYVGEAVIGIGLAALVLWSLVAANGDVTFVYQGL